MPDHVQELVELIVGCLRADIFPDEDEYLCYPDEHGARVIEVASGRQFRVDVTQVT